MKNFKLYFKLYLPYTPNVKTVLKDHHIITLFMLYTIKLHQLK